MIPALLSSYELTLNDVRVAVGDLSGELMVRQFPGSPNHPAWTLGHIACSAEAIGGELGIAPWLPPSWATSFGTGSIPLAEEGSYPSRTELVEVLGHSSARVARCLEERSPEELGAPLPDIRYRSVFPTLGHAVVHTLCGHASFHLGQLSAWRRAAGLPCRRAI